MTAWQHVIERTDQLVRERRQAVRLANLSVAAQIAARRGHYGRERPLDGAALTDAVFALAVDRLDADTNDVLTWSALAADTARAASVFTGPHGMDAWVQAFQAADPGRKSRGAYATPPTLARPMARLLLRGGPAPNRVVDPSAGAGGLLVAVLLELQRAERAVPVAEHARRLHGLELDPVARELCCLGVWLAARQGVPIGEIANRIMVGNAITRDWWAEEPYDALIMNPPWDSLRHAPSGDDVGEVERKATIDRLSRQELAAPDLPPLYSAQGRGDRNLYKAFVELAPHLLSHGARLVALVPGAWSSDLGTQQLRRSYLKHLEIDQWTSFENLRGYFPIDGRYKFGFITGRRNSAGTSALRVRGFGADANDLGRGHIKLEAFEIPDIGGPAWIIPDLTSSAEARLMVRYARHGVGFFDSSGPFGGILYDREVDITEDRKRGLFERLENSDAHQVGDGHWLGTDGRILVPLLEGRMVGQYDFFEKSWVEGSGRTAVWTYTNGERLDACCPQFLIEPAADHRHRLALCDVTSATNTRTVLATWVPPDWRCGNTAPALVFETERHALAALAVLNSMVFDWLARRLVAGLHLNRFYLDALSWPTLSENQIDALARAAAALQQLSPRYQDLPDPRIESLPLRCPFTELHVLIEHVVAEGYGLTRRELEVVYSPDPAERRGFWRHFSSDPHARPIVQEVLGSARSHGAPKTAARRRISAGLAT
jgi:hypothetical protein